MPRTKRIAPGGMIFHVLNRANARVTIFEEPADFAAFERVMAETCARHPMRILGYLVMPNHWHLVLWPRNDGDLGRFMQRLTTTHVRRWHLYRGSVGFGHLYQGIYKSFPVQSDEHLPAVLRYVERNAARAGLVERAEDWEWSSLWRWRHPKSTANQCRSGSSVRRQSLAEACCKKTLSRIDLPPPRPTKKAPQGPIGPDPEPPSP